MIKPFLATALVLCAFVPAIAGAQSVNPGPLSASETQATKPETYRSAFQGYIPYTEEAVGDWKATNATTAKIGGWRAYAKEARQPQAPDSSADPGEGQIAPVEPAKP